MLGLMSGKKRGGSRQRVKPQTDFAERLQAARIMAGYEGIKEAAAALGVEYETYRLWEAGQRQPKIDKIPEICRKFKVSADFLLKIQVDWDQTEPPPGTPERRLSS